MFEQQVNSDILFERNDDQNHDQPQQQSLQLTELRRVINESPMSDFSDEIIVRRKRIVNKLLDIISIQNDISSMHPESIVGNPDVIDEDMIIVGKINKNFITIDIPPINITIDLSNAIKNAVLNKKPNLIRLLMEKNVNIFEIEQNVMIMAVETDQDELVMEMISKKIPVFPQQYRCVMQLAANGKLDLVKAILKTYRFPNIPEIIMKICIQAINNNHVHFLEYFFTKDAFVGAPDQMFVCFINSIGYGGHLDIIKFFINNGINIKQQNYLAVHNALKYDRKKIIEYFYEQNPEIIDLLTEDQRNKFDLVKLTVVDQYIGTQIPCYISYEDIINGDTYFQCENKIHFYKEETWNEWRKRKDSWSCPHCQSPVKKILYTNKELCPQNNPVDVIQ
jgi:hypothetical protein